MIDRIRARIGRVLAGGGQALLERLLGPITQPVTSGIRSAWRSMLLELHIAILHRRGVRQSRKYRGAKELKLHLGCGPRAKPGWVNADLGESADVLLDLRRPLPFDDGSCAVIYSEHFFEHLDYPRPASRFLADCRRLLKPGGRFRVVVPDIDQVLRAYVNGGTDEYYEAQRRWNPDWCRTQIEHVNFNFRQGTEHRFAYDWETLRLLLERCGFVQIERRDFEAGLDSEDRRVGSLYVDCVTPGGASTKSG